MSISGSARPVYSQLSIDAEFHRTYTVLYEVITTDATDGPALVGTASGLPPFGSTYTFQNEYDDFAYCNGATIRLREVNNTRKLWSVEVKFETAKDSKTGGRNQRQQATGNPITERKSPIDEPWEVSGNFAQFQRPVTRDQYDNPIQNTVEEPFIPAVEIDDSRKILVLHKNTSTISLQNWVTYSDSVNSNPMWGLQPRQIKLNQWRWQVRYFGQGVGFVENEWEFHISFEKDDQGSVVGWTHVVLNEGYRQLLNLGATTQETKYEPITFKDQQPKKPTKLDVDGNILAPGGTPYYNKFKIYKEYDFSTLGFPDPLPGGVFV